MIESIAFIGGGLLLFGGGFAAGYVYGQIRGFNDGWSRGCECGQRWEIGRRRRRRKNGLDLKIYTERQQLN